MSNGSLHYKGWYKTPRWRKLRREIYLRDKFICQKTGRLCTGRGNDPDAPIAHHIVAHKGDPELFWDRNNIETVCKEIHDSLIQREEKQGYQIGHSIDGRPVDPNHPWNRTV